VISAGYREHAMHALPLLVQSPGDATGYDVRKYYFTERL